MGSVLQVGPFLPTWPFSQRRGFRGSGFRIEAPGGLVWADSQAWHSLCCAFWLADYLYGCGIGLGTCWVLS